MDEKEAVRKCGCDIHLKINDLIAGLYKWRMAVQKQLVKLDPGHEAVDPSYFDATKSLTNFCNHVCPCVRAPDGNRRLACARGNCAECRNMRSQLTAAPGEEKLHASLPVKYK